MIRVMIAVYCLAGVLNGAEHYVREGAAGNGSGNDWANAYPELPNTLTRGDTYYLADGEYPDYSFDDTESGDLFITIKKATLEEHGTGTGWDDSYGDGSALFHALEIKTDRWVLDGSRRTAKDAGHGFRVVMPYEGWDVTTYAIDVRGFISTVSISNITLTYTEIMCDIGEFPDSSVQKIGYNHPCGGDNVYIAYCYFHHLVGTMQRTRSINGLVIERNYYENNKSYPIAHGDANQIWGSDASASSVPCRNVIVRYNEYYNIDGTACVSLAWGSDNIHIYGNVFYYSQGCERGANGPVYLFKGRVESAYVYNNTMVNSLYGTGTFAMYISNCTLEGTDRHVYNNLWFNSRAGVFVYEHSGWHYISQSTLAYQYEPEATTIQSEDDPFVDWAGYDFHPASTVGPGKVLTSESWWDPAYDSDVDRDGNTRGTDGAWDMGAYEFTQTDISIANLQFAIGNCPTPIRNPWVPRPGYEIVDVKGRREDFKTVSAGVYLIRRIDEDGWSRVIIR